MARTMLAGVLHGKEDLRLERIRVPSIGPSDILVRVRAALTCGTDLKVYRRGHHAKMITLPAALGHELAGDVVAAGGAVRHFAVGERVVAANSAPCLKCFFCRRDEKNLCENLLFVNGSYAEFIRIPGRVVDSNTYRIPDHVDYREAALCEPLACVLKGIDEAAVRAGDTVAVIGLGAIGLLFVRVAKIAGARVIAIGRRQEQLDRAEHLGAEVMIESRRGSDPADEVRRHTEGGRGADIVIEAVGSPHAWRQAVAICRPGGTVNFFGGCPKGSVVCFDTGRVHYGSLTLTATFHHTPDHMREALDLVSRGDVQPREFIGGEAPLDEIVAVFQRMATRHGQLKTAVIPAPNGPLQPEDAPISAASVPES